MEYIKTKEYQNFPVIELEDINGVMKLAESGNVKFIFSMNAEEHVFFFPFNNIIYKINANGYETLEDYQSGFNGGFPKAEDFYEAKKGGFHTFAEYDYCRKLGISQRGKYMEAKNGGYVKGFPAFTAKYEKYKKNPYTKEIPGDIDNAIKLYEFAKMKGFEFYTQFEKVYDAGFPDMLMYNESQEKSFRNANDYFDSVKKGFNSKKEYDEATNLMIGSKKEFDDYFTLKTLNTRGLAYDELQLTELLCKEENGKKLSLREIREKLWKEQEKYKRSFNNSEIKMLPLWYTKSLDKDEQLKDFLSKKDNMKDIGLYDKEKDVLEIFRISPRKIFIDGSNVAYSSINDNERVAKFRNILLVVNELKNLKFKDITVIADATLKHRANDHIYLQELQKNINYKETPSHTSADEFLINCAKKERCLIVSNDTFSDWKQKDKWLAKNADRIRLPFIISKGKVEFAGIEKFVRN